MSGSVSLIWTAGLGSSRRMAASVDHPGFPVKGFVARKHFIEDRTEGKNV